MPSGTTVSKVVATIASGYQNGQDVLAFAAANGITGSWNATAGTLTLTGSATAASYQTAIRAITYKNTSQNPATTDRAVNIQVVSSTTETATVSRVVQVAAVNDAPVLSGIETFALAYVKGMAAKVVSTIVLAKDVDNTTLAGATIAISANYESGADALSFVNTTKITGAWDAAAGVLTLTGADTVANYQTALRAVKFVNTSATPSTLTRTVTFTATDGVATSAIVKRDITVQLSNAAPVLAGIETTPISYVGTAGTPAVALTSTLTVTDSDTAVLNQATVKITGGYKSGEDLLSIPATSGITVAWTASSGQLTLSGRVSPAAFQAALRTVTYRNTGATPTVGNRVVTFGITDGIAWSNYATRTVSVVAP
jgi:hypothetical protein